MEGGAMRKHLVVLLALSALTAIAVSVAWATMGSGVTATPLARGAGGEFRIKDEGFRLRAKESTDVALVNVKLGPNGYTGWHGHVSQSLVVVKTGQITMYAPGKRGCEATVHNAGTTFVHPGSAHNFVNTARAADGTPIETEIYIVYFVPEGASPAAIDVTPAPAGCPT
jgi:quercetin dioxygenase-like cupin family protein